MRHGVLQFKYNHDVTVTRATRPRAASEAGVHRAVSWWQLAAADVLRASKTEVVGSTCWVAPHVTPGAGQCQCHSLSAPSESESAAL